MVGGGCSGQTLRLALAHEFVNFSTDLIFTEIMIMQTNILMKKLFSLHNLIHKSHPHECPRSLNVHIII